MVLDSSDMSINLSESDWQPSLQTSSLSFTQPDQLPTPSDTSLNSLPEDGFLVNLEDNEHSEAIAAIRSFISSSNIPLNKAESLLRLINLFKNDISLLPPLTKIIPPKCPFILDSLSLSECCFSEITRNGV